MNDKKEPSINDLIASVPFIDVNNSNPQTATTPTVTPTPAVNVVSEPTVVSTPVAKPEPKAMVKPDLLASTRTVVEETVSPEVVAPVVAPTPVPEPVVVKPTQIVSEPVVEPVAQEPIVEPVSPTLVDAPHPVTKVKKKSHAGAIVACVVLVLFGVIGVSVFRIGYAFNKIASGNVSIVNSSNPKGLAEEFTDFFEMFMEFTNTTAPVMSNRPELLEVKMPTAEIIGTPVACSKKVNSITWENTEGIDFAEDSTNCKDYMKNFELYLNEEDCIPDEAVIIFSEANEIITGTELKYNGITCVYVGTDGFKCAE